MMTQLMYGAVLDVAVVQHAIQARHSHSIGMLSYNAAQKPSIMLNVAAHKTWISSAEYTTGDMKCKRELRGERFVQGRKGGVDEPHLWASLQASGG